MEQVDLAVDKRTESGKRVARRLRKEGLVPANLHGMKNNEAVSLSLNGREFLHITRNEAETNVIFNLCFSGTKKKPETAILKEVQHDPVKGSVKHIDFLKISLKDKITVSAPVHLVGQSIGVKDGGVIDHLLHEIELVALPADIPEHIDLDITELKIGDSIHVSDLSLGDRKSVV